MAIFYYARRTRKLRYYGDVIHSFLWNMMVVFKMRDSVPIARVIPVFVIRYLFTSLIQAHAYK